jgi:predicted DNA-binding protein
VWLYNKEPFEEIPEGIVGYVYLITNLTNNRKYIGKKNFYFSKTRQVKGKKKRIKVESDWKDYWSSSKTLQMEVKEKGKENFKREILYLCKNKSQMSYYELREQIDKRVMENDDYYNEYIMVRIHKTKSLCL